jgi:hypothetical protein
MGNAIHEVRRYVLDMLRNTRRALPVVASQLRAPQVQTSAEASYVVERLLRLLNAHADDLAEHLQRLGGGALVGEIPEPVAGGTVAAESIQKVLRDDYAMLGLAQAAALMLETNARTLGFSSTAALGARHREEISSMLAQIREFLPLAA